MLWATLHPLFLLLSVHLVHGFPHCLPKHEPLVLALQQHLAAPHAATEVGDVFLPRGSGNDYIAFILPLLSLLPAQIFPEGMQDCQLLQAHPAAPGEAAGKFCLHRQQASESYLRCGQQGVCGESAASIWASWKDSQAPAAGAEGVAGGGRRGGPDHGMGAWGGADAHKQLSSAGLLMLELAKLCNQETHGKYRP